MRPVQRCVFAGWHNAIFYALERMINAYYQNFTGTGNTINANHPVVRDHILAALRYWMLVEMHVDGFRFDLASVLGRDETGKLLANAPLLERIAEDPILRDVKIIAEAWDAAGAYEVGSFSDRRWAEWNGRYRDDVRRFWRGDDGMLGCLPVASAAAPISIPGRAKARRPASISSPATMALL
jgi:isoamylase